MKLLRHLSNWLALGAVLCLAACSSDESEPSTLETVQAEAAENWGKAVELSQERWAQIKSFSVEEWQSTQKSIVELKEKVVETGHRNQERVTGLMNEVAQLQREAREQLKTYSEASGEKAEQAKAILEQKWDELQSKVSELRETLADG